MDEVAMDDVAMEEVALDEVAPLRRDDEAFLLPYLPPIHSSSELPYVSPVDTSGNSRPFVTLTWAQSLDGKIAIAPGERTTISGPETKSMTHYLRMKHDAILVGVGTANADDPGLNCRYPGAYLDLEKQPRPIIIDPTKRWNGNNTRLLDNVEAKTGRRPWLIHSAEAPREVQDPRSLIGERLWVGDNGIATAPAPTHERTPPLPKMNWTSILKALKQKGIESVMIEGGATIIRDLQLLPELVDSVIITFGMTSLGQDGVGISPVTQRNSFGRIHAVNYEPGSPPRVFGNDFVLCTRLTRPTR